MCLRSPQKLKFFGGPKIESKSAAAKAANNTKLFCVTAIKKINLFSSKRSRKHASLMLTKTGQQSCGRKNIKRIRSMEVILSRLCKSFTGTISKRHGYAVRQREERYYGVRNNRGYVPPEGHLMFIYDCAGIAEEGLLFSDIRVTGAELIEAAEEAGIRDRRKRFAYGGGGRNADPRRRPGCGAEAPKKNFQNKKIL